MQISGPPEFLNNRTEADEEASARDAEHAKRISRKKKKVKPKGTHNLFASLSTLVVISNLKRVSLLMIFKYSQFSALKFTRLHIDVKFGFSSRSLFWYFKHKHCEIRNLACWFVSSRPLAIRFRSSYYGTVVFSLSKH